MNCPRAQRAGYEIYGSEACASAAKGGHTPEDDHHSEEEAPTGSPHHKHTDTVPVASHPPPTHPAKGEDVAPPSPEGDAKAVLDLSVGGLGGDEGGGGVDDVKCSGNGKQHVVDFALASENEVRPLVDWVLSLCEMKKEETGVAYGERHMKLLFYHVGDVREKVLRDKSAEGVGPWASALGEEDASDADEYMAAAALYTHAMSCEKVKAGLVCTHEDCDRRVALYEVMNAAMRGVGQCARTEGRTLRELVEEVDEGGRRGWRSKVQCGCGVSQKIGLLASFQPLVVRLLGLMRVLPKVPRVVFRGTGTRIAHLYKVGGQEVWSGFSSTSDDRKVAQQFADGTMFAIATCEKAVDIDFGNLYGEKEVLFAPNTVFNVAWKLSPTLLRMLGLRHDVVVLTEEPVDLGEGRRKGRELDLRLRVLQSVMQQATTYFTDFVENVYVEGRVAREAHSVVTTQLHSKVAKWVKKVKKDGSRHPLCLIGGGGTGKTSAAVALMGWLLGAGGRERPLSLEEGRPVFPVFVPLPVLLMRKNGLLDEGGIDEYVRESFGLTAEEQERLREDYDVVLVLDSLDEVGVGVSELREAVKERSLLSLHPWCASCSVVVTTRGEYLEAGGLVPAHMCGDGVEALYLRPFTDEDVEAYVRKMLRRSAGKRGTGKHASAKDEETDTARVTEVLRGPENKALRELVGNPFVLHMAVAGRSSLPWMGSGVPPMGPVARVEVYEAYLGAAVREGLARLRLKTSPKEEEVLELGELLGCWMLGSGAWAGTVEKVRDWLKEKDEAVAGHLDVCLQCLPVRLESLEDEHGIFTFTHKTVGEYLAARRLWRSPDETLKNLLASRCFSKEAPNVLRFFAALRQKALCDKDRHEVDTCARDRSGIALLKLVQVSATDIEEHAKVVASNAMSMLCHGRYTLPVGTSLQGVEVCEADLRHLVLGGVDLGGAVLRDNWFDGSTFHSCNLTRTDWEGSSLGAVMLPMRGHERLVTAVAVTLDGRCVVSGGFDKTIRVWDLETGKAMRTLKGHTGPITTLAVTPDGRRVVSGSEDETIRIWSLEAGNEMIQPLKGHSGEVTTLTVTPDGQQVISGSNDMTIRVWDLESGKEVRVLEGHSEPLTTLTATPDGRQIVSGSVDTTIRVWDLETGNEVQALEGHSDPVITLAVTPDGRRVVSGSVDMTIRVWDLKTRQEVMQVLEGHSDYVTTLAVTPDGRQVVSGSEDKTIRVWDLVTGKEMMQPLEGHGRSISKLTVTPNGRRVVSGSDDETIRVWDLVTGKEVMQALEGHSAAVAAVAVTPDGRRVVSGSWDKTIRVWDSETGREMMRVQERHSDCVTTLAVTPDGRRVVSGSRDKTIRVRDLVTGEEMTQPLEGHSDHVTTLVVTPDGRRVVSGSEDKTIRVWDLVTGKEMMQPLEGHSGITTVAVTADGRKVISGNRDSTIQVWDSTTGDELMQLEGHSSPVSALAVTPDGRVVSGSWDTTIRVWDLEAEKEVLLEGHSGTVNTLAVTPDGLRVVSGSDDKTIRTWDLVTGKEMALPLEGHSDYVTTLAVTPDGRRAVSGGWDKTIRVWDLESPNEDIGHATTLAVAPSERRVVGERQAMLAVWGRGATLCSAVQCTGGESVKPAVQQALLAR